MNRYYPTLGPDAEREQDNAWVDPWIWPRVNVGPRRSAPREEPFRQWDPFIKRWHQGHKLLPNFTPNHYFTRPHDGKRPGFWGRVKDACTGEGADVFITSSGDKRTLMRDRPQRWQWTGWPLTDEERIERILFDKDFRWQDLYSDIVDHKFSNKRERKPLYNFRDCEFASVSDTLQRVQRDPDSVWTSAFWPEGAKHGSMMPLSYRNVYNEWWTRVHPGTGRFPGGRPRWW